MAPLVNEFRKEKKLFVTRVCVTAQHREMLDQVMDFFEIHPEYDLDLMRPGQNLFSLTAEIIESLQKILEEFSPDYVFTHGDTTTTMASSIAAFYSGSEVCHVEAGLRTYNRLSPFPEEMNRQITGRLANYHFAPTSSARKNLIDERINQENILVTGNTVIDALLTSVDKVKKTPSNFVRETSKIIDQKELILVTGHRRENHGAPFIRICEALKKISIADDKRVIIYPVHLNPKVQDPVREILSDCANVFLIDPLPYPDFIWLMQRSKIVITDSGGVQEEAPSLGKPVIVLRETTERPEALEAGTVILAGTDVDKIFNETTDLLTNVDHYEKMSKSHNPYGDGKASHRIVEFIKNLKD